jgi:hypothetical protein
VRYTLDDTTPTASSPIYTQPLSYTSNTTVTAAIFLGNTIISAPTSAYFLDNLNTVDTDGIGIPDYWQLEYFGYIGVDPDSDPDGNGYTLLQDFQMGSDPTNYFSQGHSLITPAIAATSGNNQTSPTSDYTPQPLVVTITDSSSGAVLANAPVTFSVTSGGGQIATYRGGPPSTSLSLTTNSSGAVQIYYLQPATAGVTSAIGVASGGQSITLGASSEIPPPAVVGLNDSRDNPGESDLSWTLPANGAITSITIQQSTDGGLTWTTIATLDPTATSYTVSNLDPSQSYSFRADFSNSSGSTDSSTGTSTAMAAPQNLTGTIQLGTDPAGQPGGENMNLSWTASPGATLYVIDRENLATGVWTSAYAASSTTTYSDTAYAVAIQESPGFHYRVSAIGPAGVSGSSNEYPVSRYAVIDLGTTFFPSKITNSGYILESDYDFAAVWHNGQITTLQPASPPFLGEGGELIGNWFVYDIGEDGTVKGLETDYSPDGTGGYMEVGDYMDTWAPGSTTPTTSPYDGSFNDINNYAANQDGDTITWHTLESPDEYYFDSTPLDFAPSGLSSRLTTGTTINAYVVGDAWGTDPGLVWWDLATGTTHTDLINKEFEGEASINAATATVVDANGNSTVAPAVQILGVGGTLWEMDPTTGTFGAPSNLSDLLPAGGDWVPFGFGVMTLNEQGRETGCALNNGGAIVGAAFRLDENGNPVTRPDGTIIMHGVMHLPAELAVDANRDGTIAMANYNPTGAPVDTTSQTQPFRFWVNDGQNVAEDTAALYGDQVPSGSANYLAGTINLKGDLENFTRLWIYTGGLQSAIQSGAIKVALQWQNVTSGAPAINVYQAVSSDGGTEYLNDDTTAGNQIAGTYGTAVAKVTGTSPVVLPASLFSNLSSTNSLTYCLFEGAHAGNGELVMVFEDSNGNVIGQGGQVYMSLKTVTDMYEQAQVTPPGPTDIADPYSFPGTGNWNSSTPTNDTHGPPSYAAGGPPPTVGYNNTTSSNFEHPADETKNCILFVHGWNVTNQRYLPQSIECFTRLWLQGYKGLYAAIRWPGDVTGSDTGGATVTADNAQDYFEIEYRAFKYGGAVKQYASFLEGPGQGYTVGVMAHSMGNIVSSEALHQGANFEYVMMDAAVSSRCYDTSASLEFAGVTFNPPDLYTSGGYGGYFSGLSGLINCYNPLDSALTGNNSTLLGNTKSWEAANTVLKGQTDLANTSYVFTGGVGVQLQYNGATMAHPQYYYRDVFANTVTNYHESMAMYAETRTQAAGTEQIGGAVSANVYMQNYFPNSDGHSPQFDLDVSDSSGGAMQFYQQVLTELNFQ